MRPELTVADTIESFVDLGGNLIGAAARDAITERGRFFVALSGGSTSGPIFARLATLSNIQWDAVHVFLSDERFVAFDNPYSNFALLKATLLDRVPIPSANVHPVPVTTPTPEEGALAYEDTLRRVIGAGANGTPIFDMVQLGMGPDGHTASLFPGSPALNAGGLVSAAHAGLAPWVDRVTLTLRTINAARCVLVAATGKAKAVRVREALMGLRELPVACVSPVNGRLVWLVDAAAASDV